MPSKLERYVTQGWKGLPFADTQAYWVHSQVMRKMGCCDYDAMCLYLFTAIINSVSEYVAMFDIASHFHSSIIFAGKAGAYPSGAPYRIPVRRESPRTNLALLG